MKYCYITGTSRGLGKAIAEQLLELPDHHVIGISRGNVIQHPSYQHIFLDLGDLDKLKAFQFEAPTNADSLLLINNSGTLGEVAYCGNTNPDAIINAFQVNLIAPALLMNAFVRQFQDTPIPKLIINISSGAGKKPVDGWAAIAAPSGLDLFSEVVEKEQQIQNAPIHFECCQ